MNPDTGAIAIFENDEDARAAGHTLRLTPQQAQKLLVLNRHERRAELSRQRRAVKAQGKGR